MIEITPEYLVSQDLSKNFEERFWSKVKKTDFCWLWTGCRLNGRYGRISRTGTSRSKPPRDIAVHVASWLLRFGPIRKGLNVLHRCDVPYCVNPSHLWLGTHADNMRDMVEKGRAKTCHGEQHALHKLNKSEIRAIRNFHTMGITGVRLAKIFRVSPTQISNIIRLKQWASIR